MRLATALDTPLASLLTPASPPREDPADAPLDPAPLDHNAARLLRRVHRGEDVRRTMTCAERELTVPNLMRRGLIVASPNGIHLTAETARSLGGGEGVDRRRQLAASVTVRIGDPRLG